MFVVVDAPWFWVAVEFYWPRQGQEQLCAVLWLELWFIFGLGLSPVVLPSSQGCEGIVLLRYAVVGLRTVLAWPVC